MKKYIEIPYKKDGHTFDGCDCYGLIILYYQVQLGIELLSYKLITYEDAELARAFLENYHRQFERIPAESVKPNDIVLICNNTKEIPNHCGIVLEGGRFLHALENVGCNISKLAVWKKRIHGFYRYKHENNLHPEHI